MCDRRDYRPRKVPCAYIGGGIGDPAAVAVERIGKNAQRGAAAIDTEFRPCFSRTQLLVALRNGGAGGAPRSREGKRSKHLGDGVCSRHRSQVAEILRPCRNRDRLVAVADIDHLCTGRPHVVDACMGYAIELNVDHNTRAFAQQTARPLRGET